MPGSQNVSDAAGSGPEGVEAARLICLRLLAAGPRTRAQLFGALRRRRVPEDTAAAVLDRFAEVGLIDDAAFARAWVETRHHGRGLGRRVLSAELRRRGIEAESVRVAVGTIDAEQELATARRLVEKRLPGTRGRPPATRIRQLVGMLARKGYPADVAYRAVREALEQDTAGVGDTDRGSGQPAMYGGPGGRDGDSCWDTLDLAGLEDLASAEGGTPGEDWAAD